ncbi:MAG: dephospho-CoA kinase [Planctomycetota bacterium]|nr:MAG: dephospho-CoA kinase [Planctomycetota bacterium]
MPSRAWRRGKPTIGLCGGIGSGKSTVARLFGELGCLVIDSDALNREVLKREDVRRRLVEWWGCSILDADGELDRAKVAKIVFSDPQQRDRLESLTHPLIGEAREAMILQGLTEPKVKAFILDSPLLFERNLDRLCDSVVFVDSSEPARIKRLEKSRGWDAATIRARERWQLPLEEKRRRSQYRIPNDGSLDELRTHVARVLRDLLSRSAPQG